MTNLIAERIRKLSEELNILQSEMHLVIDMLKTTYGDLQAVDETTVSNNEELQRSNEPEQLEEAYTSNEDLLSINKELRMQNDILVESDRYTKAILDTIHEPMVILNNALQVRSANHLFHQTFNPGDKALDGISIFEIIDNQWDIPELHEFLEAELKRTDFRSTKMVHTFPHLGRKVMLLNATRIEQKPNREQLILLAIQDITELAHKDEVEKELLYSGIQKGKQQNVYLENTVKDRTKEIEHTRKLLKDKNAELDIANKDLSSFTYVSSHDLQEPLRKIQVFSDILLNEEKNLSRSGKALFKRLQDTAKRMQMLFADLLSFSLTKKGGQQFEKVHLNTVVDQLKLDFDELIDEYDAEIEMTGVCEANIIPFQFSVLMNNLINNALRFSHPDRRPHITISCKIEHGSDLRKVNLNTEITYCHITVEDNGIGFDNQYRERIFEVFERLDGNNDYPGTGIGLAICRRIVENHKGIITATGFLDKGARFDIYIPATRDPKQKLIT